MELPINSVEFETILKMLEKDRSKNWQLWSKLWSYKINVLNKEKN